MKEVFLFPHRFKVIGWVVLVPAFILSIMVLISDYDGLAIDLLDWEVPWYQQKGGIFGFDRKDNFTNELAMLLLLVSLVFIGFSKTKEEDEYVQKIRHDSLVWSMYVNYGLLFLAILVVYDLDFFNVMVFNMFTPLIIFIIRFHYYYAKR